MSYPFAWLTAEQVAPDETFRVRRRHSPRLAASVARAGIRAPLLVQPRSDERWRLVSGWGRWLARPTERPVPCFLLPETVTEEELWTVFLRDNDEWNVVEIARILTRLRELPNLTPERIVREFLPELGLKPSKELYRRHLRLAELSPAALDFVDEERLPLRRASLLLKLSPEATEALVPVARRLRLTLNECAEAVEWLGEIEGRDRVGASRVLAELVDDEMADKKRFRKRLRQRRFPQLHAYHQRLEELRRQLHFTIPVGVEWDWRLENPGLRLRAEIADPDALSALEEGLAANRQTLTAFFEVL